MRRWLSRQMHRFAWFLDRKADDLWDMDYLLSPLLVPQHAIPTPTGAELAQAIQEAYEATWKQGGGQ